MYGLEDVAKYLFERGLNLFNQSINLKPVNQIMNQIMGCTWILAQNG